MRNCRLENIEENAQSYFSTGHIHASCDVSRFVEVIFCLFGKEKTVYLHVCLHWKSETSGLCFLCVSQFIFVLSLTLLWSADGKEYDVTRDHNLGSSRRLILYLVVQVTSQLVKNSKLISVNFNLTFATAQENGVDGKWTVQYTWCNFLRFSQSEKSCA